MTTDTLGPKPDKHYWSSGNAHAGMEISGLYVLWHERALARAVELLEEELNYSDRTHSTDCEARVHPGKEQALWCKCPCGAARAFLAQVRK